MMHKAAIIALKALSWFLFAVPAYGAVIVFIGRFHHHP